ncbi:MAG: PAS domain-containing protein [Bacteroidia bacterium]|nr:PAS domain-containing protein [Bacteroidia bacterium]
MTDYFAHLPAGITVCDRDGIITYMNDKAAEIFAADGGRKLIGSNVLDCHPEPSRTRLVGMLASGELNAYTIEKAGKKKLIYQSPWHDEHGAFAGIVEFSLELPEEMPHFVRTPAAQ